MMRSIDIKDAISFAIELEKAGQRFYKQCHKNAAEGNVKQLLAFLATQEEKHLSVFKKMLENTEDKEFSQLSDDNVSALMDIYAGSFFSGGEGPDGEILPDMRDIDILDYGTEIENNSVEYYQRLKTVLPEESQADIDHIINTEKEHLQKLQRVKKKVQASQ